MSSAGVPFGGWLVQMRLALRGERDADVPCGSCTACCRASQFVEIGPEETDTLAHLPRDLLFPAPGRPGHLVMGYDEHGCCPMLRDDGCSIYEHRPQACRTYDCRVFAATGVEPDDAGVAARVREWMFTHQSDEERADHDALHTAVVRLRRRTEPVNATALAVRAIEDGEAVRP